MTTIEGFVPNRTSRRRRHLVAVLAFDEVVLGDLAAPCEVFARARAADGHAAYEIRLCSESERVASKFTSLHVPWRLASVDRADTVIVPGVDDIERPIPAAVRAAILRARRRGARVASICTGAFVLAAAGVLDGLRATTHWLAAPELARRYPHVSVDPDVLYVDNGQVLTSAGAAAALDLCLYIIRRDFGADVAAQAARAAVMPLERAGGQAQFISYDPPTRSGSTMGNLLAWIEQHLTDDLTLPTLARRVAMSPRTFFRRFREQVGTTPAAWIARARITHAQRLLETTDLSVETIAAQVGLRSSTVLREHFARTLGIGPTAYRRSFSVSSGGISP